MADTSDGVDGPPAGWYADPRDSLSLRWWDGWRWTNQTQPARQSPGSPCVRCGVPNASHVDGECPGITERARQGDWHGGQRARHARPAEPVSRTVANHDGWTPYSDTAGDIGGGLGPAGTAWTLGDGSLAIEYDSVVLTFSGAITNAGKKRASPRRIPFASITGIELKKPGVTSGYLRFLVAGSDSGTKFNKVKDLNTLIVYVGANYAAAKSAVDMLRGRIGRRIALIGMEPTDSPSAEADNAPAHERKEEKREKLAQEASAGGSRPDIAAAARRMRSTFGGKREIRLLHQHVGASETVSYIAQGTYREHQGITVLTDRRLLFVFHGWVNQVIEDFPLDRITAVSSKTGLGTGTLIVHTGGARAEITSIVTRDLKHFVDALRQRLAGAPESAGIKLESSRADLIEQIRELGELRDQGILTDTEFDAKKSNLLRRI